MATSNDPGSAVLDGADADPLPDREGLALLATQPIDISEILRAEGVLPAE